MIPHSSRPGRSGLSLLEVLVGLSILAAGILAILSVTPTIMRANERAELRTIGAALAYQKIEEVRRDNDAGGKLINQIKNLTTPTAPVRFGADPRLSYRFSGVTLLYRNADGGPDDPRTTPGVARVIIMESPGFRARPQILDEYRFN